MDASAIETPALVVDLDILDRNISAMASETAEHGTMLRPHVKTHKCTAIAELQVKAGAVGITAASVGEAEVFAAAGMRDIFIAYPVWARGSRGDRLARLADECELAVGVDSVAGARGLASVLPEGGCSVRIEIDSGQHRTGVSPLHAGALAVRCAELGLRVGGIFTHEGHAYTGLANVAAAAANEEDCLRAAAEQLASVGLGPGVISAGSSPTARSAIRGLADEVRPGTYVFNDRQQIALGSATGDEVACYVLATVVSNAVPGQVVLDAGSKALGTDKPEWLEGHGVVVDMEHAVVSWVSECHGVVKLGDQRGPELGTRVRVVPNHICNVVNLFDRYELIENDAYVGHWNIDARGKLQ